jgi:tRNA-Thr(GGU) m(6)t(6)A37 methyltransferase TsaA
MLGLSHDAAMSPQNLSKPDFGHRQGEVLVDLPATPDAGVYFIGRIRTPWTERESCPKNPAGSDAVCTVELDHRYAPGLKEVETCSHLILLYWMDKAQRNLVRQVPGNKQPGHSGVQRGTFALRSPARPNPIAVSVVKLIGIDGNRLSVVGLDCLDGTPLIDIKPYLASIDSKPDAKVGWREQG